MSELDWVLAVIILISTIIGVSRGMVREIFALIGWVAAFFVSLYYAGDVAQKLPLETVGPMLKMFLAVVLIVIACVFAAGLIGKLLRHILSSISIGAEDRLLGCLFGFLRGVLIVGLLVYLGGSTEFVSKQIWWKDSNLVPYVEKGIVLFSPYIPKELFNLQK